MGAVAGPARGRPATMWVLLAAAVVAILGSFLPWATVSAPIIGAVSKSGTDGPDGWIAAGLGVLLAGYAVVRLLPAPVHGAATALAGLVAAALIGVVVLEIIDLRTKSNEMKSSLRGRDDPLGIGDAVSAAVQIRPGAGLWLVAVAGLTGAITLIIAAAGTTGPITLVATVGAVAALAAGGVVAAAVLTEDTPAATGPRPSTVKGIVGPLESTITVNLADGHYLKLGLAVQFTADVTAVPDLGPAAVAVIDTYTGRSVNALRTESGRAEAKLELLDRLKQVYPGIVLDVYFTSFVTQ